MNDFETQILKLYKPYTKVLGPYTRKDGRKQIVLNNANAKRCSKNKTKTISYPKALVEAKVGYRLAPNETVDHKDRNFRNDDYQNLKVLDRRKHATKDARRVERNVIACVGCETVFLPSPNQTSTRSSKLAGPFCSKICSGRYGAAIQHGKIFNKYIKRGENLMSNTNTNPESSLDFSKKV